MGSLVQVRALIRDVPDFPQPGILFKDITPVLGDPKAFQTVLDDMEERLRGRGFDRIVAIESRGFVFGAALADRLKIGLSPVRKLGKLPYKTDRVEYALEYGKGVLEAHVDSVRAGEKVAIVDDLLATGGTAWGAAQLVRKQQGEVGVFLFFIELTFLKGRERLADAGGPVEALIAY
ncbi:MAG TPA: adenine phosphoribosyltransferase [Myxococcales bacterium]|jgi:adenine phosphoribosyltransferase|nr:adenine phosphoribosyltransferase [Myxococcales bacterium]